MAGEGWTQSIPEILQQSADSAGLGGNVAGAAGQPDSPSRIRGGPLLEGAISRTDYILGPGDVLTLSVFGYRSQIYTLDVSPEGTVVIPTVGVARVGGLNVEDAERAAARIVRRYYQDVEVHLTLAAVRSFKVFLLGDLPEPGVRRATAVTRVSEVIPAVREDGVIRRNVVVRRAGGDPIRVDLAGFLQTGDLTQNPTLREGDVIHAPPVYETVSVSGSVAFPGVYEFRPAESLAQLLAIANGGVGFPAGAADTIRLLRFNHDSESEVHTIARDEAIGAFGRALVLEPFDGLYIPRFSHFRERTTATVGGEVRRPGLYPIQPDSTTVGDLVEMAGGLTEQASLADALLRRSPVRSPREGEGALTSIPPEMLSRDELRILRVTNRADEENVVLHLEHLLTEARSAYDVPLQHGDNLYVPMQRQEIAVLGAVFQPGIVAFEAGQTIDYFVGIAGGYTRKADRGDVVVLKGRAGSQLSHEEVTWLEPGDRIIVPFAEPRTFMERLQTVEGVVSTISGLILTIVALDRIW
jgi:protein involved in polysaccharide export with SLBB domain